MIKPNYKVVDETWRSEPQRLVIRINPGRRGFPAFRVRCYNGDIQGVTIEGFPFVKNQKQYMAYLELLEDGLHDWLSLVEVFETFEKPDHLILWLRTTNIRIAGNIYTFEKMKLKHWEKPYGG